MPTWSQPPLWSEQERAIAGKATRTPPQPESAANQEKLVSIIELSGNSNEDAYAYANYWSKLDICAAAGIPESEAEHLPVQHTYGRIRYTAEDGTVYVAEHRHVGGGGPPTNIPLRHRRTSDEDWPG